MRFKHIEDTAKEAVEGMEKGERLRELRRELKSAEEGVRDLREELKEAMLAAGGEEPPSQTPANLAAISTDYESITDPVKLERLIKARGLTMKALIEKLAALAEKEAEAEAEAEATAELEAQDTMRIQERANGQKSRDGAGDIDVGQAGEDAEGEEAAIGQA